MENRVNYYERQFLRAQDFRDEQAYHIAMRRRHAIAQHSWGIARGLELLVEPEGGVFVQPGLAIDGYGRELLLPERRAISATVFDEIGSDRVNVYLYYGRVESTPPRPGYDECEAGQFTRAQEQVNLRLVRADPEADPRCPREVPAGDLDFNPARRPPDSPLAGWPVFVGQLVRDAAGVASALTTGRPYVGLVGEAILTPSRRARVVIGDAPPAAPNDRRFAVFLRAEDDDLCGVAPAPEAQLEITTTDAGADDSGLQRWATRIDLRGETTVYGNVAISAGALQVDDEATEPGAPQPWRVYRVTTPAMDGGGDTQEMRIEMPEKPANGPPSHVTVGAWSSQAKRFVPCLTVTNDCRVIVQGNLIAADFIEDPRLMAARADAAQTLMAGGGPQFSAVEPRQAFIYQSGLTPEARSAVSGMVMSGIAGAIYRPFALNREESPRETPSSITDEMAERIADDVVMRLVAKVTEPVADEAAPAPGEAVVPTAGVLAVPPPATAADLLLGLLALDEAEWESAMNTIYQSHPGLADTARAFRIKMYRTKNPQDAVNP
ncbi:MAG: hypothetical protein KBG73_00860 [Candidatus Promineofilum sp.]|nr:hypothetical protein [Promineifilum sp.]